MTARDSLDPADRIKIETWFEVMRLLRHYRDTVYLPEYQLPPGVVLPSDVRSAKERRNEKLATLQHAEKKLEARWAEAVGPNWESILDPND